MTETCHHCGKRLMHIDANVKACPRCDQDEIELLGEIKDRRGEFDCI